MPPVLHGWRIPSRAIVSHLEQTSKSTPTWSGLLLDQLARVSTENKDRLAVRFGVSSMSYGELESRSNELGAKLVLNGVGGGDLVGIGMQRSLNTLVCILGVWKAGAAYVPLDPDYPQNRLSQILQDAAPRALITDEATRQRFQFCDIEVLILDRIVTGEEVSLSAPQIAADHIAYVIFTSGSTGRPKGVRISHGALANFLTGIQQSVQIQSSDTLLALTTPSFDISILEMVLPLMQGAAIVIADRNTIGDGKRLAACVDECDATFMQATPTTWRLLLDAGWMGKNDLTIICGGENLARPLADELLQRSSRLFNAYGPTEATIWATIERVQSGAGSVPIGRALNNYKTFILNDSLKNVAPGDTGQLYLGGAGLATDYLNHPEETARHFVVHPEHGRLYATGDLVRETAEGKLEFAGRLDDQVKIRGFRVEMGDIEAQLAGLAGIRESIVMLREDTPGDKKLVAYIIPDGTIELASGPVRSALSQRLPDYMIPHHYVLLDEFPTTPNNKVDRKRLAAPRVPSDGAAAAIHDPLETYLRSIWMDVLGIASIGCSDDFFDLGGDSIQAARVTNRVEEWLGEVVWPVVLFDAPTITEFADYLRATYPGTIAVKSVSTQGAGQGSTDRLVDQNMVDEFNALITPLAPFPTPARKNRPAIFVLNPPRSGSTLLRVMLAGHPRLFAPPEIELLTFNTMGERFDVFSGREKYRLEGTIRAVMEIKDCGVEDARTILESCEKKQTTVAEFYGLMQSWLGDRFLVDKTPANTLDLAALRRIEDYFEDPIYIHLTRHPLGMIRSFLEAKLSTVFFRRASHNFSPRELAELIWLTSHRNTLATLATVPAERQFRVSFETLTRAPEEAVQQLCNFLAIEYQPAMLRPWENKAGKMTDGLHPESKMMGDPKFHQHKSIDPSAADRWQDEMQGVILGSPTRTLAHELGYSDFGGGDDTGEREQFSL